MRYIWCWFATIWMDLHMVLTTLKNDRNTVCTLDTLDVHKWSTIVVYTLNGHIQVVAMPEHTFVACQRVPLASVIVVELAQFNNSSRVKFFCTS